MATVSNSDKITGGVGIVAAIVFLVAMMAAIVTKDGFTFGNGNIGDLFTESAFVIGCVVAGILGAIFGLLITFWKAESNVFIGKIRGILIFLSGITLAVLAVTEGNEINVYLFVVLISLAAASDTFYNWVTDQKVLMIFSLILMLFIVLTGILSQTGDNNVLGFAFVTFVAIWVILMAVMRFVPVIEAEPQKKGKVKQDEAKKKNAPAPRPYPAKKEELAKVPERLAEKPKVKEQPKKEEPPAPKVKEEPKPAEPEVKKEPIKVMSSREAAAARESARKKEEPEPIPEPEPVQEPKSIPEPAVVPVPGPAEEETETYTDEEEEYDGEFDLMEETPDALLRRATWNKGLRCRRDYGKFQIPIAYVKAKVAVYVQQEPGSKDAALDEEIKADGWVVLRYLEKDITDGKEQAEEINRVVKESLKAERAAKKKKSSKK